MSPFEIFLAKKWATVFGGSENEGLVHYIVKKYKAVDAHTTAIA